MKRAAMRAMAVALAGAPLFILASGCGGVNADLVELICTCEHCDDWREEELLVAADAQLEAAEAYGCEIEWETVTLCQIDQGECEEEAANWTVQEAGNCAGSMNLMIPCTTNAECASIPSATCAAGTCSTKVCNGGMIPCSKDSECPGGDDKCEDEKKDFFECIDDASEHQGPSGDLD